MAEPATHGATDTLESDVRARLSKDTHICALGRYEVVVNQGRATLVGHVRSRDVAQAMVEAARDVQGVEAVDEQLVVDDELELRVAVAIASGALNRATRLLVRAEFGRVRIGGLYPSPEARTEAIRLGGEVPGVLGATLARASDLIRP